MYLFTIIAFGLLFWQSDQAARYPVVEAEHLWLTLLVALGPMTLALAGGWWAQLRALRLWHRQAEQPQRAQSFHHRATVVLRTLVTAGYAAALFLTPWADWFQLRQVHPALQIFGDLAVMSPFWGGVTLLWVISFPYERALRSGAYVHPAEAGASPARGLRFGPYLESFLRNQLLVFAVPLALIQMAANLTRGYERSVRALAHGWPWAPDVALGAIALVVFILAPALLTRIWSTEPLPPGPLRTRLEAICTRIGLRCRDILVWKSDGLVINAAVMGVAAPIRFVLLSDGLLQAMEPRQVEAVFGHEAGHVRHHHIQHFLAFALVGWLIAAGAIELLLQVALARVGGLHVSGATVQGVGLVATVIVWGVGFGWISRRFERQADVFGARCVMPEAGACGLPCSVHLEDGTVQAEHGRVCATGAVTFASALDRVAVLNGIPHQERSWRHSSIASRIRFLTELAGDPARAVRFDRVVRRIKVALIVLAVVGSAFALLYVTFGDPAMLRPEIAGL